MERMQDTATQKVILMGTDIRFLKIIKVTTKLQEKEALKMMIRSSSLV